MNPTPLNSKGKAVTAILVPPRITDITRPQVSKLTPLNRNLRHPAQVFPSTTNKTVTPPPNPFFVHWKNLHSTFTQ